MNVSFVLSCMENSNYRFPGYVRGNDGYKSASTDTDTTDIVLSSQHDVWLSHLKLACDDEMRAMTRQIYQSKVKEAAFRYGMMDDLENIDRFIDNMQSSRPGIESYEDFQKAAQWVFENADKMDLETRRYMTGQMRSEAIKVGHVFTHAENYAMQKMAGEPVSESLIDYAEKQIVKLASGTVYTREQFKHIPYTDLADVLPEMVKAAYLGESLIDDTSFNKAASKLSEQDAHILDLIMEKQGQAPLMNTQDYPIEINDEMLASL